MFNLRSRTTQYATLLALLLALFAIPVLAQQGFPTDDDVNKVAKQLYCPVCESTPLDVCPTEACRQWRDVIRTMLAEGKTEAEIKQYFVTQYGARVLNEPPNRWLAYLVPGVAILLGTLMLIRGFQMWIKPVAVETSPGELEAEPVHEDEYVRKLEEELKKRK